MVQLSDKQGTQIFYSKSGECTRIPFLNNGRVRLFSQLSQCVWSENVKDWNNPCTRHPLFHKKKQGGKKPWVSGWVTLTGKVRRNPHHPPFLEASVGTYILNVSLTSFGFALFHEIFSKQNKTENMSSDLCTWFVPQCFQNIMFEINKLCVHFRKTLFSKQSFACLVWWKENSSA